MNRLLVVLGLNNKLAASLHNTIHGLTLSV